MDPELPKTSRIFTEFIPVTAADVLSLIAHSPTKSSPLDPVPKFLLKKFTNVLVEPITKLVNLSLSLGVFPDYMKLAVVTPLLKKPDLNPDVLKDYRPVSNLSFLSKIIEYAVVKPLHPYLETESESLFVPLQSAYRPIHSTENAILKVVNDLFVSIDEKDVATVIFFLDQSAPFELVDRQILIDRLSSRFVFRGLTLVWFRSYLSNRRQSVSVRGQFSSHVLLPSGVPQGSVLGPILYN